ncbi:MAG: AbrB/MazE/SpoVT family DNA-binding domain-containing protein [Rhizomicrobium sp.]
MKTFAVKINSKLQITLPKEAMCHLGLPNGGQLVYEKKPGGRMILRAATAKKASRKL